MSRLRPHRFAHLAGLLLLAVAAGLGAPDSARAEEQLIDGIAAQVGSEIVLVSEVQELAAPIMAKMREAGRPEAEMRALEADALERLIETKLIASVVKRAELKVSGVEIDTAIQGIAAETGLTLDQLRKSVESHGLTYEEYRAKIRSEIEKDKAISSAVRSQVRVEPDEVQALYAERFGDQPRGGAELHLRHIVVAYGQPMRDDATACKIARDARKEIEAGASFQETAFEVSDANKERGGDLGWVHEKDLAAWMAAAVRNTEDGKLTAVIEMPFGCNLLQVVERRAYEPVDFVAARPRLEQELFGQKAEAEYRRWMNGLREQVYVERKGRYAEVVAPPSES